MFKRIQAPKFRIGRYMLNEYELRNLMLEVAQGNAPEYINAKITDEKGNVAYILDNGSLDGDTLPGLSIASQIACKHMTIKNKSINFLKLQS